jgi:hypothetical protein
MLVELACEGDEGRMRKLTRKDRAEAEEIAGEK